MVGLLTKVVPREGLWYPSPDLPYTPADNFLFPDDPRIDVSDYYAIAERSTTRLRFIRPITDGNNYQHCSPGSRARIYTTATSITFRVYYNNLVTRPDARNFISAILVDGVEYTTFTNSNGISGPLVVIVNINVPNTNYKLVELVWPYGDGMDLLSIEVNVGALFDNPPARPSSVLVTSGDSITHGFWATKITKEWAYGLAKNKNREFINIANGSAVVNAAHANVLSSTGADRVTYMIGYNNFAQQTSIPAFQSSLEGWINNAKVALPSAKIYVISPIYSPNTNTIPLSSYRAAVANAVLNVGNSNFTYVDGLSIMSNFSSRLEDGVHPNDTGSAEIITNLTSIIA